VKVIEHSEPCTTCDSQGRLDDGGEAWVECWTCHGSGEDVWNEYINPEEEGEEYDTDTHKHGL